MLSPFVYPRETAAPAFCFINLRQTKTYKLFCTYSLQAKLYTLINPDMTINDDKQAHAFYAEALNTLKASGIDYMLGGAFAVYHYTGLFRDTKDLDVYCRYADCTKILKFFADKGYSVEYTDVRWLAKIFKGEYFIDVIFDTVNNICKVDDSWFNHGTSASFFECEVKIIPAEELFWCKIYVQNRERYDGADMNHILLKAGKHLTGTACLTGLSSTGICCWRRYFNFSLYTHPNTGKLYPNGCLMN